jgi:hypothetical protein
MPRRSRSELPDGVFHVTAQAIDGSFLFVDDQDRSEWLLGEVTARFRVRCLAYGLMGSIIGERVASAA